MSKKILQTLAESLEQMHMNHEPLSWGLLASAIDIAIRTAPEGVQDTTDDTYATAYRKTVDRVQLLHEAVFGKEFTFTNSNTVRDALKRIGEKFAEVSGNKVDDNKIAELVSENLRLNEALETNCEELNKLRSEITKAESQTITMFSNFGINEASMGLQNNLHALSLRHQTVVASGKFVLDEVKKERDILKEQVVELEKSEGAVVDFQNQLMNLFPEISKSEDYDTLNTLQKVYEQAMSLQVKVAELSTELKAYKNPWLSPGDIVVLKYDIMSDNKLLAYARAGEEAIVQNYDVDKRRATLRTMRNNYILVDQHLFDKKA